MPRRHGLRTVALGERDGDRQALTRQVLACGSAVLTRTPEAGDGQQMETVRERLLLLARPDGRRQSSRWTPPTSPLWPNSARRM